MAKIIRTVVTVIIFCGSVTLIILGQTEIGLQPASVMLVGLAGLLILLTWYNRRYK